MLKGIFVIPMIATMLDVLDRNEERKAEIQKEFNGTKNLPRKQKKKRRKELNIDYAFLNWDPFQYTNTKL